MEIKNIFIKLYGLALYRPLRNYSWARSNEASKSLTKLFDQQIDEHKQELQLQKTIPVLSIIEDETSVAVRNQYEENPYPRWVNTSIEPIPYRIPHFFNSN